MSKIWYTYILQMKDGRFYTGITNDLNRCSVEHLKGNHCKTTEVYGANDILYSEKFANLTEAVKRERQVKKWTRAKKLALIKSDLEELKRLSKSRKKNYDNSYHSIERTNLNGHHRTARDRKDKIHPSDRTPWRYHTHYMKLTITQIFSKP